MKRQSFLDLFAVFTVALVYLVTQWYVYLYPAYDSGTFLVGAITPLVATVLVPMALRRRILFYAFLAYFWALVEDGPVYLDSVFTWPEVTRFNPAAPHFFLEALYHLLTALFLILTIREAAKGRSLRPLRAGGVDLLTIAAFGLAYFQNIPIGSIQAFVETQWYQLDIAEHLLSVLTLFFAIKLAQGAPA
jgi:hypothetical protein